MHKLFEFIRSTYAFVLFVVLELFAIHYYANSTYYTQAKLMSRSNSVVGGLHGVSSDFRHYFLLGRENRELLERVGELTRQVAELQALAKDTIAVRTVKDKSGRESYRVMHAQVVSNSVNKSQNFIVLNRGMADGVTADMTLLAADGSMTGYVVDCTERYAVAISVLNTSFKISGKIKGTDFIGSVYWDGRDPHCVTMTELSKYAEPKIGDEVVTAGFSRFFPGVNIGKITDVEMNETETFYTVNIELDARMSALTDVILVEKCDYGEIDDLISRQMEMEQTSTSLFQ